MEEWDGEVGASSTHMFANCFQKSSNQLILRPTCLWFLLPPHPHQCLVLLYIEFPQFIIVTVDGQRATY